MNPRSAENELQSKIELARREEQLVEQRGQNERKRATEKTAAARIDADGQADRQRVLAASEAEATRVVGAAKAEAEAARLAAYREIDDATILGLAVQELAGNLPEIGSLVVTPDLLAPILARLANGNAGAVSRSS